MTEPLPYVDPYRCGWRSRLPRHTPRRIGRHRLNWLPLRRPWQCEVSYGRGCTCSAVRAFTRAGAMARMDRTHQRIIAITEDGLRLAIAVVVEGEHLEEVAPDCEPPVIERPPPADPETFFRERVGRWPTPDPSDAETHG